MMWEQRKAGYNVFHELPPNSCGIGGQKNQDAKPQAVFIPVQLFGVQLSECKY
jgi:hypothetical protein